MEAVLLSTALVPRYSFGRTETVEGRRRRRRRRRAVNLYLYPRGWVHVALVEPTTTFGREPGFGLFRAGDHEVTTSGIAGDDEEASDDTVQHSNGSVRSDSASRYRTRSGGNPVPLHSAPRG